MKNCKMAFTIGLVFAVMMLVAACTDSNKSDNHIFDHESLDVDEYVYPSDFDLGDDLKGTNSESDAGFEELSAMIGTYHYTSDYGTGRLMIGKFVPSSQTCSCCGFINAETKDLSVREWTCPKCGVHHDRDINAAKNILNEGLRLLEKTV